MARISLSSFDLPDGEDVYFKAIAKLSGSARGFVAECVKHYLKCNRDIYRDRIDIKARELGISWEECFNLYLNFDPPFTDKNLIEVKKMSETITRDYGRVS